VMTTTTTFSALFAWMQGRRLSALGWTGIAIAFAGVLLVVNNSLSRITLEVGNLEGAAFWLVAAFCWALYVDRSVPYSLRLGSLRVVAWTTLLGALVLLAVALCFDSLSEFSRLDDRLLGYWLYTGTFPVGVAYLGIAFGLDRLGVSRVMVYMYLIPVAGVGLAAAFFGDPLTWARRVALDRGARLR
jgi:drug/metabolite transporter (DMT)-like permease